MMTSILEPIHLAVVLAIALLVLGSKRLPAAGHALGSSISNFKQGLTQSDDPCEIVGAEANAPTAEYVTSAINRPVNGGSL